MISWVYIAIIAYFLTALNSVVDKYLLGRSIPHPIVYAFYVGVFSIFTIILTPFGFVWPGWVQFGAALFVGIVFLLALISFFAALKADEASRMVSIVGGITPIFILILSTVIFGDSLKGNEYYALALLVLGTVVISARRNRACSIFQLNKHECARGTELAILAALFFALFFISARFVFDNQEFISGFIWTRIGSFLAAFLLLLIPSNRRLIFNTTKKVGAKMGGLFIANKALAGFAFLMLNYAIAIGNVTLVNALEGVKYLFLLLLVFVISKFRPAILQEETTPLILLQKSIAITLIFLGILLLSGTSLADLWNTLSSLNPYQNAV